MAFLPSKRTDRNSRLFTAQVHELVRLFALEVPARTAAANMGMNRHTPEGLYAKFRRRITLAAERDASSLAGAAEVVRATSAAAGKTARPLDGRQVGRLRYPQAGGMVYTWQLQDVSRGTLMGIIRRRCPPGTTVYSDQFSIYDGLVMDGYEYVRINHWHDLGSGHRHING